jgi:hypothetical protein
MGENKTRNPQQQQNDPQRQAPGQQQQQQATVIARTSRAAIPAARLKGDQDPQRRRALTKSRSVNVKEGRRSFRRPFS